MLNTAYIKNTMLQLGLTQAKLATMCDVSKEAVSNWLSGESVPRPNKLKLLSETLSLELESLFKEDETFPEPVVAYRTRQNRAVTGAALSAANDLAQHLRELVPFVRRETLFASPVLEAPNLGDDYIREATRQIRARIGVTHKVPLGRKQLIELHHDFGSLLVPALWGKDRAGHENALSVYLPDSKASWVVFNLNAKADDFNYWLAHELGHCYTLHALRNVEGEKFAERFAQELLFPFEAAADALDDINSSGAPRERASWYAGNFEISVVTVIRQADRVAKSLGKKPTGLETPAFWAEWNSNRHTVPTVVETIFDSKEVSAEEYVLKSETEFSTPVFRALAQWQQREGGRSPAFIAASLNIGLGLAFELSHVLAKLHGWPSESADSLNKRL